MNECFMLSRGISPTQHYSHVIKGYTMLFHLSIRKTPKMYTALRAQMLANLRNPIINGKQCFQTDRKKNVACFYVASLMA